MKVDRLIKDAIYFEEFRKQKASFESDIRVHEKLLAKHQQSSLSLRYSEEAKKKIPEINAILEKEPPSPELPPRQPLIKVCGMLEEIEILFTRGFFTDREYETEEFVRKERSRHWGSVLLAVIGESAAAAVSSQGEIRQTDVFDFVKGKVNGVPFYGWFGRTTAKQGDYIELAVVAKGGHYEAYALAVPELRIISMLPRCYQSVRSKAADEIKGCFIMPVVIAAIVAVVGAFALGFNFDMGYFQLVGGVAAMTVLYSILALPFTYRLSLKKPKPTNAMAQKIFTVLEMKNPEDVNLERTTKEVLKNKSDKQNEDRVMPKKNLLSDYYYFY
ncbi:putative type VI secretion system effector [Pantoea sp. GD03673]|uniref:putative type VI secretion system effector n=1 Tax=Pantoea sp. GD03673 TaxID=2975364 RepID=UPI00244A751D|nr:putative type VI secretion system effector [Pantoea sp. GD03673]MDH2067450.1 hypothetical protein [Pantoea sp. GD03673]